MNRLVKKRAKKLSEDETGKLMDLVHSTIEKHKAFVSEVTRFREEINREVPTEQDNPEVHVNFQQSYIRSTAPSLYFSDPKLKALPQRADQTSSAKAWDALLEAAVERVGMSEVWRQGALDLLHYGEFWEKWGFQEAVDTEQYNGEAEVDKEVMMRRPETGRSGPTSWDNITAPRLYRLCPTNVYPDCPTRKPDNSRFIVLRYRKFIDELVNDPRYPDLDKDWKQAWKDGQKTGEIPTIKGGDGIRYTPRDDAGEGCVWLYEVWVHQLVGLNLFRQLVVLVDGFRDAPVRKIDSWEDLGYRHVTQFPIHQTVLLPVPDGRAAHPLKSWSSINKAINLIVSRLVGMTSRLSTKYILRTQSATNPADAEGSLLSNCPVEVIKQSSDAVAPVVDAVQSPNVPSDIYNTVQVLMSLQTQVSGLSQNQRGGAGVRTATEASIIGESVQIRLSEMVQQVTDGIKRSAETMVRMLRDVIDSDFVFRITGDVGGVKWQNFSAEDAAWSPDIRVEPNSFRKADLNEEAQKYLQAISVGAQIRQVYDVRLDVLYHNLLKRMEIQDADLIVGDPISPQVKQLMEIIQMIASGEPSPVLPTDNHQIEYEMLKSLVNDPETFGSLPPGAQAAVQFHMDRHEEALKDRPQMNIDLTGSQATFGNISALNGLASSGEDRTSMGTSQIG